MTNNTWQITPIGEQIELLTDYTANGSFAGLKQNVQYYNQSNYAALVRTTDLEKKIFAPERFTDKKGYDFLKKSSLIGGEIVLANVGSIGKVYRVPQYHLPMTLAPNMYLIRFKKGIDKNYAFQYLTSQIFQRKLLSNVASTTLSAINKSNLRSITIPVPPLGVQQRIGDILTSIDEVIQKTDQIIQKSEELKQGLMQELLVKGSNDFIHKLDDIAHLTSSKRVMVSDYVDQGIPFYRSTEIIKKSKNIPLDNLLYIPIEKYNFFKERFGVPQKGDILVTAVGTIGIVYLVKDESFYFKDGNLLWIKNIKSSVLPEYLKMLLSSKLYYDILNQTAGGSSQKALTIEKMGTVEVYIPTITEQKRLIDILTSIDDKLLENTKTLQKLKFLKSGLMHDIFNQKVQIN